MITDCSGWKFLPDLLLEQIFTHLSWKDRLKAACTCKSWNQTFYNPALWKSFTYHPPNYLEKYSQRIYYDIATYNLSNCFKSIGYCFQMITILPISDFFILNRALKVIGDFYRKEQNLKIIDDEESLIWDFRSKLEIFSFEFASQIENGNAYGTGGVLLDTIKSLLDVLSDLKVVRIKGLLLDERDRHNVFDCFIEHNRSSIWNLSLVDIGKTPLCEYGIVRLGYLTHLELGVCEIDADLLIHLVQETRLKQLVLTQTRFTLFTVEFSTVSSISHHAWDLAIEISPDLRVHQRHLFNNISEFIDLSTVPILFQPHPAPVSRFVFSSNNTSLLDLAKLDLYHSTFTELIIVVNSATDSNVRSSIDDELFQVTYTCPHLETLVLGGERLSVHSATILQLLLEGSKKLKKVFIEDNVIQYSTQTMSIELFNSYASHELIAISSDPILFVSSVRSQLHLPAWSPMNSKQFASLIADSGYVS